MWEEPSFLSLESLFFSQQQERNSEKKKEGGSTESTACSTSIPSVPGLRMQRPLEVEPPAGGNFAAQGGEPVGGV